MSGCESCRFRKIVQTADEQSTDIGQQNAARTLTEGIEKAVPDCEGWSAARYTCAVLFPSPPIRIMKQTTGFSTRLMPPYEEACRNPYRATDEFWDARADLEDANLKADGINPLGYPTARTVPEIQAHAEIVQEQLRSRLGGRGTKG